MRPLLPTRLGRVGRITSPSTLHAPLEHAVYRHAGRSASTLTERQKHLPRATSQWTWAEEDLVRAGAEVRQRNAAFPLAGIQHLRELRERNKSLSAQMATIASKQNLLGNEIKRIMSLVRRPVPSKPSKSALQAQPDTQPEDHGPKDQDWEKQVALLKEEAARIKIENNRLAEEVEDVQREALDLRLLLPNSTHSDVPLGPESEALVVAAGGPQQLHPYPLADLVGKPIGQVSPPASFPSLSTENSSTDHKEDQGDTRPLNSRDHLDVATRILQTAGGVDMASGVTAAGSSWPFLLGRISMLEHALTQFSLSLAHEHGFLLVSPPEVVRTDIAARCGFNPRGEALSQTYYVNTGSANADPVDDLCLVGTAEIALAALLAGKTFPQPRRDPLSTSSSQPQLLSQGQEVPAGREGGKGTLEQSALPLRLVAVSHAFRAEAGARGTDTRGLYRVHQFSKTEMFVVCPATESDEQLEHLRAIQEKVVTRLGLPYRVLNMPSEELGASAARKYDIEVWMPGRESWGEVSSASNCTDYQSRRLALKHRTGDPKKRALFAHTLNATAAAVPRLIVALLENYGAKEGRLCIPSSLKPFWLAGGRDELVEWIPVAPDEP